MMYLISCLCKGYNKEYYLIIDNPQLLKCVKFMIDLDIACYNWITA